MRYFLCKGITLTFLVQVTLYVIYFLYMTCFVFLTELPYIAEKIKYVRNSFGNQQLLKLGNCDDRFCS